MTLVYYIVRYNIRDIIHDLMLKRDEIWLESIYTQKRVPDETYIVLCCSVENKSSSGRVIQLPVTDGNGWTLRELPVVLVDGGFRMDKKIPMMVIYDEMAFFYLYLYCIGNILVPNKNKLFEKKNKAQSFY